MAVPAHDERDYEFAKKFNLDIIEVLQGGDINVEAYTKDGIHINSEFLDGLNKEDAIATMNAWLLENKVGEPKTTYKLRDWLFSRQRYWGEPIPIILMEDGTKRTVEIKDLPLELPSVKNYKPSSDGESPLANAEDWLDIEIDGVKGRRETNTMPQWAGSCWYYMRYIDPKNSEAFCDRKLLDKWLPVDLYVGGAEHAVLHLLYSRFWHKVLYDLGYVSCKEPFKKLFHQGMILGENGEKMSKSRGNVVNPDEIFISHGADSLRVYEMFMGPLEASLPWNGSGLDGIKKWLDRVHRLFFDYDKLSDTNDNSLDYVYNATVKKVGYDIETLNFNTAISSMMVFINECYKANSIYKPYAEGFVKMFACFAPHLGEEIWNHIGHENTLSYEPWPTYDEEALVLDEVEVVVQVSGKIRGKITVSKGSDEETLKKLAFELPTVIANLEGKTVVKTIVIIDKIVNIVAK